MPSRGMRSCSMIDEAAVVSALPKRVGVLVHLEV